MSAGSETTNNQVEDTSMTSTPEKSKGKAAEQRDLSMDEEESSEEESGAENQVAEEEEDEDNMEEIDADNILEDGRRTRGKNIDFAKAAENAKDLDDDEDDDEDFEDPDENMKD